MAADAPHRRGYHPPVHDDAAARAILAATGLDGARLTPIGVGFASDAWLVDPGDRRAVLRVANGTTGFAVTYAMEHAVMARLMAAGAHVPTPIAGNWDLGDWDGPPFSLTTHLPGVPLPVGQHQRAAAPLAAFLRTMHALGIDGYGGLVVREGILRGEAAEMEAGLLAWCERPLWPLGGARLADHPALAARPDLADRIEGTAPPVRAALRRGPAVPVHSDLHEENILDEGGSLGIIDFGESLVAPAAWEFASLAYFLGWPFADRTLAAYLEDAPAPDLGRWRADASAIALCFGVHRWRQDRELGVDEEAHDEAFLEATLARVTGRE